MANITITGLEVTRRAAEALSAAGIVYNEDRIIAPDNTQSRKSSEDENIISLYFPDTGLEIQIDDVSIYLPGVKRGTALFPKEVQILYDDLKEIWGECYQVTRRLRLRAEEYLRLGQTERGTALLEDVDRRQNIVNDLQLLLLRKDRETFTIQ